MTNGEHLFLVGCGGHGRVVLDAALASGLDVTGIVDSGLKIGEQVFGVPVLGGDEILAAPSMDGARWLNGIGANPDLRRRREIFETMSPRFVSQRVQHPSVVAGRMAAMGDGVQLMAGVVLQNGTSLGDNSVVNTGARLDHDCNIGRNCFVAPGATLCGDVTLADRVFIGAAAVILPGVKIGQDAVVGAGSVVTADVPTRAVVVGNPATIIKWNGE